MEFTTNNKKTTKTMKKFKLFVGAMALFAIVAVNVWNATTSLRGSELSVADVEAIANPEGIDGTDAKRTHWVRDDVPVTRYNWQTNRFTEMYDWHCIRGGACERCKKGDHEVLPPSYVPLSKPCIPILEDTPKIKYRP